MVVMNQAEKKEGAYVPKRDLVRVRTGLCCDRDQQLSSSTF